MLENPMDIERKLSSDITGGDREFNELQGKTWEENQVAMALRKAEALHAGNMNKTPEIPLTPDPFKQVEEDDELRNRLRMAGGIGERIMMAEDAPTIQRLVREFMGDLESNLDIPNTNGLQILFVQLLDKAKKFEDAQDEDHARKSGLAREGLVSSVTVRKALKPNGLGGFEMELNADEARVLRQTMRANGVNEWEALVKAETVAPPDGEDPAEGNAPKEGEEEQKTEEVKWKLNIEEGDLSRLQRDPSARIILGKKIIEEVPAKYTKEDCRRIAEESRQCINEIKTRWAIAKAWYSYEDNSFSMSLMAKLGSGYTGIETQQWKTLVSLDQSIPGEMMYGDKIDLGMRLHALLAVGGGVDEYRNDDEGGDRQGRLNKALASLPAEVRAVIEESEKKAQEEINSTTDWEQKERLKETKTLLGLAKKNIITRPPSEMDDVDDVKAWVRKIINGGKTDNELDALFKGASATDTKSAEQWAWRLFKMWGLAAHFDNRGTPIDKKELEERGVKTTFDFTAMGPASSDDTSRKAYYFEQRRLYEAGEAIPHGPDATLGKYPNRLSAPFLHSTLIGGYKYKGPRETDEQKKDARKLKYTRSLHEIWANEGKKLRELPWNKISNSAWFQYNYQLSFIGKERSGFYALAMAEEFDPKIFFPGALRDVHDTVKKAIKDQSVHGGEVEKWLAKQTEEVGEMTSSAFIKRIQRNSERLILLGLLTTYYQGNPQAWKDVGYWPAQDSPKLEVMRQGYKLRVKEAGTKIDWDSVVKEAGDFLFSRGILKKGGVLGVGGGYKSVADY